jgi:GntR family transcriptional regulator, transcriptional repressor for pyruvate dehydrogenase complex
VNAAPVTYDSDDGSPAAGEKSGSEPAAYRPGYELVAEQILQLIGELALSPGDRLPTEMNLAVRLGASRTMVREAVKILSAIGRVRAQKGRGLYVADGDSMLGARRWSGFFLPTNLDHILVLFEFRRLQEAEASRLAATRASPAELRVMETAAQSCRDGYVSGDQAQFETGDDDFHLGVATASHNFFLVAAVREARMLQRQVSLIGLRGVGGHAADAVDEHDAIFGAIRDGEPEAAAHAACVHLDNTLQDYRREIQRRVFGENVS